MTKNFTLLSLSLLFSLFAGIDASATSINVTTPGSLSTQIGTQKNTITDLSITGSINGDDIAFLREMAGAGKDMLPITTGALTNLDLSSANIIAGGDYYVAKAEVSGQTDYYFSSLNSIGEYMFFNSKLESIILPKSITEIENDAFGQCTKLKSITIGDKVTEINEDAFVYCISLPSINLPASLTTYEGRCFGGCSKLDAINVDANNRIFSSNNGVLFNFGQTELLEYPHGNSSTSYTIPSTVNKIQEYAFASSNNLNTVIIPISVNYISNNAFANSIALSSITIPNSVTMMESESFEGCTALQSVVIGSGLSTIAEEAFMDCSALSSLTIGSQVGAIHTSAFSNCSSLTTVTIPDNVIEIDDMAFKGCSNITTLSLGRKVASIDDYAFGWCANIATIHSYNTIPPTLDADSFLGLNTVTCALYVPQGSLSSYQSNTYWSQFINIAEEAGINSVQSSSISISKDGENIIVSNAPINNNIEIYTPTGVLLYRQPINDSTVVVKGLPNNLYIIRIGPKTFKVII